MILIQDNKAAVSESETTMPQIKSETNLPPHYQCYLQVSETVSCYRLRCCYSANILQHWVRGDLIYFCKVDHSKISKIFSSNWVVLSTSCEILQVFFPTNLLLIRPSLKIFQDAIWVSDELTLSHIVSYPQLSCNMGHMWRSNFGWFQFVSKYIINYFSGSNSL